MPPYRLEYAPAAERDLAEIYDYLAREQDEEFAARYLKRMRLQIESLQLNRPSL